MNLFFRFFCHASRGEVCKYYFNILFDNLSFYHVSKIFYFQLNMWYLENVMKSESQLCLELGIDKRIVKRIRTNTLSQSLWKRYKNSIYYTDDGEHTLRNEIMKHVMLSLDLWVSLYFYIFKHSEYFVRCIILLLNFNMYCHHDSRLYYCAFLVLIPIQIHN